MTIDEIWYVPALIRPGHRRPMIFQKYMRTTRKAMIRDFIDGSYSGQHDWKYRRKLGWRAVRIRVTGTF